MGFCKWLILGSWVRLWGPVKLFYLTFFTERVKQATACWTRRMIVFEHLGLCNGWSRPAKRSAEPGKFKSLTGPSFFRPSPPKSNILDRVIILTADIQKYVCVHVNKSMYTHSIVYHKYAVYTLYIALYYSNIYDRFVLMKYALYICLYTIQLLYKHIYSNLIFILIILIILSYMASHHIHSILLEGDWPKEYQKVT